MLVATLKCAKAVSLSSDSVSLNGTRFCQSERLAVSLDRCSVPRL